jgi:hypothetical protein
MVGVVWKTTSAGLLSCSIENELPKARYRTDRIASEERYFIRRTVDLTPSLPRLFRTSGPESTDDGPCFLEFHHGNISASRYKRNGGFRCIDRHSTNACLVHTRLILTLFVGNYSGSPCIQGCHRRPKRAGVVSQTGLSLRSRDWQPFFF